MKNNNLLFALVIVSLILSLISIAMVSWNYKTQLKIAEYQNKFPSNKTGIFFYNESFSLFIGNFIEYHDCISKAIQNISFCLENNLGNCSSLFSEKSSVCEIAFNERTNFFKIKK